MTFEGLRSCFVARRSSFCDPLEEGRRKQRYYIAILMGDGGQKRTYSSGFLIPPVPSTQVTILHDVFLETQYLEERTACPKGWE